MGGENTKYMPNGNVEWLEGMGGMRKGGGEGVCGSGNKDKTDGDRG